MYLKLLHLKFRNELKFSKENLDSSKFDFLRKRYIKFRNSDIDVLKFRQIFADIMFISEFKYTFLNLRCSNFEYSYLLCIV